MAVELETLILVGKGERIEFKAQWSDAALETLAAFANGHGGALLVGIDDDGRVIGWQGGDKDLRATTDRIADALRIQPSLEGCMLNEKRVLVIEVAPSQTPVAYHGRYYRRIGNTTRQIPPEELGRLFIKKTGITILDDKLMRGNLFRQLEQVMQVFRLYLQVRYEIPSEMGEAASPLEALQRREIWDYPLEALREAVINALIHRDYFDPYGEISIRVYDDRVYIWSPGELPPGITVEDLKKSPHDSRLRNPLLAQVFYFAGWIERWGSGTTMIVELCRQQGLPEPDFRSEKGRFEVIFYKNPYTEERLREMGLNERQLKAVLYVKERGKITNKEYQELTGASKPTATRDPEQVGYARSSPEDGHYRPRHLLPTDGLTNGSKGPEWAHKRLIRESR